MLRRARRCGGASKPSRVALGKSATAGAFYARDQHQYAAATLRPFNRWRATCSSRPTRTQSRRRAVLFHLAKTAPSLAAQDVAARGRGVKNFAPKAVREGRPRDASSPSLRARRARRRAHRLRDDRADAADSTPTAAPIKPHRDSRRTTVSCAARVAAGGHEGALVGCSRSRVEAQTAVKDASPRRRRERRAIARWCARSRR